MNWKQNKTKKSAPVNSKPPRYCHAVGPLGRRGLASRMSKGITALPVWPRVRMQLGWDTEGWAYTLLS